MKTVAVVRRATAADAPALGALGAMLMRLHYDFDRQRFMDPGDNPADGYGDFLSQQLMDEDVAIFVAEDHEAVVGYVYAGIEPRSWKELRERAGFVHDIAVGATDRRKGVAAALMEAAIDWLRQRGVPRVVLWTSVRNQGAEMMFESLGFRKTMTEMTLEL